MKREICIFIYNVILSVVVVFLEFLLQSWLVIHLLVLWNINDPVNNSV